MTTPADAPANVGVATNTERGFTVYSTSEPFFNRKLKLRVAPESIVSVICGVNDFVVLIKFPPVTVQPAACKAATATDPEPSV